jgi:hypothetical protein
MFCWDFGAGTLMAGLAIGKHGVGARLYLAHLADNICGGSTPAMNRSVANDPEATSPSMIQPLFVAGMGTYDVPSRHFGEGNA